MAVANWPAECRSHHPWQPGTVTITWEPCDCPAARESRGGHIKVRCNAPRALTEHPTLAGLSAAATAAADGSQQRSAAAHNTQTPQALDCCQNCCHGHGQLQTRDDRHGTSPQKVATPGQFWTGCPCLRICECQKAGGFEPLRARQHSHRSRPCSQEQPLASRNLGHSDIITAGAARFCGSSLVVQRAAETSASVASHRWQ